VTLVDRSHLAIPATALSPETLKIGYMAKYRLRILGAKTMSSCSMNTLVKAFVVYDPKLLRRYTCLAPRTDPGDDQKCPG